MRDDLITPAVALLNWVLQGKQPFDKNLKLGFLLATAQGLNQMIKGALIRWIRFECKAALLSSECVLAQ